MAHESKDPELGFTIATLKVVDNKKNESETQYESQLCTVNTCILPKSYLRVNRIPTVLTVVDTTAEVIVLTVRKVVDMVQIVVR